MVTSGVSTGAMYGGSGNDDSSKGPVGAAFGSRAHMSRAAAAKRSAIRNFLTQVSLVGLCHVHGVTYND